MKAPNRPHIIKISKKAKNTNKTITSIKTAKPIAIKPKANNISEAFYLLGQMPKDFYQKPRKDLPPQKREAF
jgi:hypothetical protein